MNVSHIGQRVEGQSGFGVVIEESSIDEGRYCTVAEDARTKATSQRTREQAHDLPAPHTLTHTTMNTQKNGKNRNRHGGTEQRGPVVSQEPRPIETAATLACSVEPRAGLVSVIDT